MYTTWYSFQQATVNGSKMEVIDFISPPPDFAQYPELQHLSSPTEYRRTYNKVVAGSNMIGIPKIVHWAAT